MKFILKLQEVITSKIIYKNRKLYNSAGIDITYWCKKYLENVYNTCFGLNITGSCSYDTYIKRNKDKQKCCVCDKIPYMVILAPKCNCVYHIDCYNNYNDVYCKGCNEFL